jgi:hypothetical protein
MEAILRERRMWRAFRAMPLKENRKKNSVVGGRFA